MTSSRTTNSQTRKTPTVKTEGAKLKVSVVLFYFAASAAFFLVWLNSQLNPAPYPKEPGLYESMEHYLLRYKLAFIPTEKPSDAVTVVGFDSDTVSLLGPPPWPRDITAELLVKLRKLGAKTIVVNAVFTDPQLNFLSPSAFQSLYPDLPLDDVRIINQANFPKELAGKLSSAEKDLKKDLEAAANDEDRKKITEKLARFTEQKQNFLALIDDVAAGAGNRAFEAAVARKPDVVFITDLFNVGEFNRESSPPEAIAEFEKFALHEFPGSDRIVERLRITTLYPQLFTLKPTVGVNEVALFQRPFLASAHLLIRFQGKVYPSLTLQAVAKYLDAKIQAKPEIDGGPLLEVGKSLIKTDEDGTFPIYYYNDNSFPAVVSAIDVLRNKADAALIKDKIVIIGERHRATMGTMLIATPMSDQMWVSDIKATVISNMLLGHRGPTANRPSWVPWVEGVLIWLFALLLALMIRKRSLVWSFGAGGVMIAVIGVLDAFVLLPMGIWLSSGILVVEVPLLILANLAVHYLIQSGEKQKVRRAFGLYLPKTVLEHMLANEQALKLGGERRNLSILFSDIRGFTSISERTAPEALGIALNRHLTELTNVVFEQKGTLDKYMGDCVMAFFGAPMPLPDHAYRGVRAALIMQKRLKEIMHYWVDACGNEIKIGVGVASGDVIVGNMGSENLFDYTVIGDNVNLSSRLEGLTKIYGVEVLVPEDTRRAVGDLIHFLEVDLVRVKGKDEPVRIFEAVDESELNEARLSYEEFIIAGLAAFRQKRWEDARRSFMAAGVLLPDQKLPHLYLERIEIMEKQALSPDWDGVTTFDHK